MNRIVLLLGLAACGSPQAPTSKVNVGHCRPNEVCRVEMPDAVCFLHGSTGISCVPRGAR